MSKSKSFSKNSILFVASRKIIHGFEGWSSEPKLTQEAKELVCEPEQFTERYGTYYKVGKITGSYMRIYYTLEGVEDK
jgi:hypothetical protein